MSLSARNLLAMTAATGAALTLMAAASVPAPAGHRAGSALPRRRSLTCRRRTGCAWVDVWPPADDRRRLPPTVLETDRYWRARAYTGGIKDNPNYHIALPGTGAATRTCSPTCAARAPRSAR